jgi:O-antigen ligase
MGGIIIFPFLFVVTQISNNEKKQLYVLVIAFILLTILNSLIFIFDIKNISDVLFIILFFTIYFYYKNSLGKFNTSNVYLFLGMSFLLFLFTFLNRDSSSIFGKKNSSKIVAPVKKKEPSEKSYAIENKGVKRTSNGMIEFESNESLDYIEAIRAYHFGMFRVPHVASYFFGFLTLFFIYLFQKKKQWHQLVLAVIVLLACIYTGSRAILGAIVLSALFFIFQRKYLIHLLGFTILIAALFLANDYFLQLTKDTFLYQYFSLVETLSHNVTRLSRFRIWYSWWVEVRQFNLLEVAIGKSYINAILANQRNLNCSIWFHNDFLNIFYTYGVLGFGLYVGFFVKIYCDFSVLIRNNFFLFVFYCSMVITAFVNGFYYYFPVFILYLFFLMVQNKGEYA